MGNERCANAKKKKKTTKNQINSDCSLKTGSYPKHNCRSSAPICVQFWFFFFPKCTLTLTVVSVGSSHLSFRAWAWCSYIICVHPCISQNKLCISAWWGSKIVVKLLWELLNWYWFCVTLFLNVWDFKESWNRKTFKGWFHSLHYSILIFLFLKPVCNS